MAIARTTHRPVQHHHTPAEQKPATWMKGLARLVGNESDNLDHYELTGPNSADPSSAQGKAIAAKFPASVQGFFKKQLDALADNDGSAALLKFPLSEVDSKLKGNAIAVRWTSEDQNLDRLFVFDQSGKPVAKAWTDTGANFKWEPAKGPFQVDDTPHTA
jgi:hypothetical protein